jgi:hypothetical protein
MSVRATPRPAVLAIRRKKQSDIGISYARCERFREDVASMQAGRFRFNLGPPSLGSGQIRLRDMLDIGGRDHTATWLAFPSGQRLY